MTTLATLQEFADFRAVTLDDADATAIQALEGASAAIRSYCGQTFDLVTDDVILDGSGTGALLLPQMPVVEVDYVATLDADDLETEITDYHVDAAGILWRSGYWPLGHQNITVTYRHGYATIPADLKNACMALASRGILIGASAPVSQEGIGTYTVTYADASSTRFLDSELVTLNRYRYPRVI